MSFDDLLRSKYSDAAVAQFTRGVGIVAVPTFEVLRLRHPKSAKKKRIQRKWLNRYGDMMLLVVRGDKKIPTRPGTFDTVVVTTIDQENAVITLGPKT